MAIQVQLSDAPVAWELDDAAAMFEALTELVDKGYRGQVSHDARTGWMLRVVEDVDAPPIPPVECVVGERMLLTGGLLRKLSAEELQGMTA